MAEPYLRVVAHDPFRSERSHPALPPPEPLEGRRPRILAHVLRAFPMHFAGAERMLHGVLEGLVERGWDSHIIAVEHRGSPYEWNGITVQALTDGEMGSPYAWADVVVTHLDVTSHAMAWARYGRPLLHLCHNHTQLTHHRVRDDGINYPIWNSEWIAALHEEWRGPSVVCRPPLHCPVVDKPPPSGAKRKTAVLVNLLGEKGGPLFWRLARACPDWRFIGVRGAYGAQVTADPMPPNGEVLPNGVDMETVWAQASVCLVPSWYESWSYAAVEACAHGIPVIAHPTPGLVESMTADDGTSAAVFCDRDDDQAWVDALTVLAEPKAWRTHSAAAIARANELAALTVSDLDRLDAFARAAALDNQTAYVGETVG